MRVPPWLGRELSAWERDGLITHDQRLAILSRYPSPNVAQLVRRTLIWLAILSAGVGVVVLLTRSWADIPSIIKMAVSIGATVAAYIAAYAYARRGRRLETERAALVAALLAGGALYVFGEVRQLGTAMPVVALWWSIVLALTAAVVPSAITAGVATVVVCWWLLVTGGSHDVPWGFLLTWPLAALAVERNPNRYAAGGLTLAFGGWTFFAALAVWGNRGADTPSFVTALLAGAWLDALAHSPAARRPAFARQAPALAFIVLAHAMLLPSGSHGNISSWRGDSAWLLFGLIAALATDTIRQTLTAAAWRWRSIVLTAVGLTWLGYWVLQPGAGPVAAFNRWMWTLVFSGTAVMIGASAIREFSVSRDRGVFAAGIAAVLLTIAIRAVDANEGGIAIQAALLLAVGALLLGLSRLAQSGSQ